MGGHDANGRRSFCDHCAKVVYDFTDAKQNEFAKILAENSGAICGRFRAAQVAYEPVLLPRWKQWLSTAMLLIGVNLFTQCKQNIEGKVFSQQDEQQEAPQFMGVPLIAPADADSTIRIKKAAPKQRLKFRKPTVLIGDVVVEEMLPPDSVINLQQKPDTNQYQ